MTSEIIVCPRCKSEIDLNYGDKWAINEIAIVSQTTCNCRKVKVKKSHIKPLDEALLKLKDVLNERNFRSSR